MKTYYTLNSSLSSSQHRDYREYYPENEYFESLLDKTLHKSEAKYTISRRFKRDILEYFHNDDFKNKTCLELGTSQGKTTIILSYIFEKVIGVEIDDWNISQAEEICKGRNNVEIRKFDLYREAWDFPQDIGVVFIDANHQYEAVLMDITNCLNNFDNPIFIIDDYGHFHGGVKQAVDQLVRENKIEIIKYLGEENFIHLSGMINNGYEGVICRRI